MVGSCAQAVNASTSVIAMVRRRPVLACFPMSTGCLFCSIIAGEIPARILDQTDSAVAFADINPQAPTHVLVVPKTHHEDVGALADDPASLQGVMALAARIGRESGERGFRLVFNTGPDAGQSVQHAHGHVLAGRTLQWPPG